MSSREREGLLSRVRQLRRLATPSEPARFGASASEPDIVDALESRIAHLEQMVQGLQDSVHREASRQSRRLTELETRIQPGAMGKALDENARERGL
jgi:hypothetical protein